MPPNEKVKETAEPNEDPSSITEISWEISICSRPEPQAARSLENVLGECAACKIKCHLSVNYATALAVLQKALTQGVVVFFCFCFLPFALESSHPSLRVTEYPGPLRWAVTISCKIKVVFMNFVCLCVSLKGTSLYFASQGKFPAPCEVFFKHALSF